MSVAYILLNAEIGSERDVLRDIRRIEGVQEAFRLWGIYDIIARVKADTIETLTRILNDKLQISKIHSRVTVIVTEPDSLLPSLGSIITLRNFNLITNEIQS